MTKPKIYGFGENHASGKLSLVSGEISTLLKVYTGVERLPPALKDAIRNYKTAEDIMFRLRPYASLYPEGGEGAWSGFVSAINALPLPDELKQRSLERVESARATLSAEKQNITRLSPEIVYLEGVSKAYFGIVGAVVHDAEKRGVRPVYLDENSEPYRILVNESKRRGQEFTKSQHFKELQRRREDRWKARVKNNLPQKTGLIIAGHNHLTRLNPDYPFIGRTPELVEELGVDFELVS